MLELGHPVASLTRMGERPLSEHVPAFIAARSYAPRSARQRRTILGQFAAHTGNPRARDLTTTLVLTWWTAIAHLAAASRQAHLSAARQFVAHLRSLGAIDSDPTGPIARPRVHDREPVTLTADEIVRFLASLPTPRDRAVGSLMLGCALRACDVSSIDIEAIDFAGRTVAVVGKGSKERIVPMPTATVECVTDYLTVHPTTRGPLIRHHRGHRRLAADPIQQRMTRLLYLAGVKQAPGDGRSSHVLRRTCASVLLESGASVRDVQTILGHVSLATTERYLRRPDGARLARLIELGPLDAA